MFFRDRDEACELLKRSEAMAELPAPIVPFFLGHARKEDVATRHWWFVILFNRTWIMINPLTFLFSHRGGVALRLACAVALQQRL